MLSRFAVTRQRAEENGAFALSVEGLSWMLLKACRVNDQQFLTLLQPTNGRFPRNEPELRAMTEAIRRMGRILEHANDSSCELPAMPVCS